jgi:hypothetical protein
VTHDQWGRNGAAFGPDSTSSVAFRFNQVLRLQGKKSVIVLGRQAVAALELSQHPGRIRKLIQSGSLFTVPCGTAIKLLQKNILYCITCKSVGRIRNHILVYGFCRVLCVLCLFFVFRYTNRDYNLFPFLPLCYLLILYWEQTAESNLQDKETRQLAWAAAFAVVLFSAVPLWRNLVLFPMFLREGVGLAEARREFQG